MAEKDKLSKEVEEQIQSLASDVYIQIEETLTQLISTVTPKEPVEKVNMAQEPVYLKLQHSYQVSQNELAEQSKQFSEQIQQLEQTLSTQKAQLHQARIQAEQNNQKAQNQITSNEKALFEQQQEIMVLNESLLVSTAQEQTLAEQKNIINALTQEVVQLNVQLQQAKIAAEKQQKIVSEQQVELVDFNENIKQKIKVEQDYKQEIKQLSIEQAQIKNQQLTEQKSADLQHKQQQQAQVELQQQIDLLETKNQELKSRLITEQSDVELYQKEVSSLKSQLTLAQEGQENILNRFNTNRDKQEKDNNQVRETIKYLRDENNNMITQNNIQKKEYSERIVELENKLTEYRLKFEYAQKQLTQNS